MSESPAALVRLNWRYRTIHRARHGGRLVMVFGRYSITHRTAWPLLLLLVAIAGAGFVSAVQTVSPVMYAIF